MRAPLLPFCFLTLFGAVSASTESEVSDPEAKGRIFYVRSTVGSDTNDGLSPERAWRSISMLSEAMRAGDTAFVGPGLYRDQIIVKASGSAERPIRFIADPAGERTGDPPGVVMIAGSDPAYEGAFEPYDSPGVYKADFSFHVAGVVEMDGPQYRYKSVLEPLTDEPHIDVVAKTPGSFFYDRENEILYIHTSDGQHPENHEIELMRRTGGVSMTDKRFIIIQGFTFRHQFDAGILFSHGSGDSIALGNTSYGSRQGIRVNNATNIIVSGNTLFRNENCGVYFLRQSVNGMAIGNVLYENVKGVRWSSESNDGVAARNISFDNHEAGISIESTVGARIADNALVNNAESQLLAIKSQFQSEANCFENKDPGQLTADLYFNYKYGTLREFRQATGQDRGSREGNCGEMPPKIDVRKLHELATAYEEEVKRILATSEGDER
jgi:parallel beta-helix repeat protein